MTYSIVAKDPSTGAVGIAVASRFFAAGSIVPNVRREVAFASQAFCNPIWGLEGASRLAAGESAEAVLADFVGRDQGQAIRQAHCIGLSGEIAAHTGADCVPWCGHASAEHVSVAGNMLTGPEVVDETLRTYQQMADAPFFDRLIAAMEAGERAGGDKRGKQAAGIIIHQGQDYPWLDIRADDHADPLAELRRLEAVSQERLRHFMVGMPTNENFSGLQNRAPIDEAMRQAELERLSRGEPSRSFATEMASGG
ncbi:MAG: DUF1028 domain-containing protein [Pseudomonadota bacterium]